MEGRRIATEIFQSSLNGVRPDELVMRALQIEQTDEHGPRLRMPGLQHSLPLSHNVLVVAFGKAVLGMVQGACAALGSHVRGGVASLPIGLQQRLRRERPDLVPGPECPVQFFEGARDNLPDAAAQTAAQAILECVRTSHDTDVVLVLVSGGGSALLPLPAKGLTLEDTVGATRILAAAGATIQELNTVRKHLSAIKGGQLAASCQALCMVTLVISDVIGDPLDIIASGPTVPDTSSFQDCLDIVDRRGVRTQIPPPVLHRLVLGASGGIPETPRATHPCFSKTITVVVGSNRLAVAAAAACAQRLGFVVQVLGCAMAGEARIVGRELAKQALAAQSATTVPLCLLNAGETTVTLHGHGKGGRNQELALAALQTLSGHDRIVLLSAGTDGQDGPTDATGAFADADTFARSREVQADIAKHLEDNNSHAFFDTCGGLLRTGLTGTNVMDLVIILIRE